MNINISSCKDKQKEWAGFRKSNRGRKLKMLKRFSRLCMRGMVSEGVEEVNEIKGEREGKC